MAIDPGQMLGHYRVAEKIGEGGMGVVYRAEDTKLGRSAAIKILPTELASDPERLSRFEREARVLASLNHPNIAAIHGIERDGDVRFLALEMVEGLDLFERLKQAPIPADEALKIAAQVASALESAHESGVIHRDLKPANIKVSPDGRVKVLDFGLAKSFVAEGAAADLTMSPTLTSPATQHGVILGTAPYMSPEQARGKPVDRRTDVWAFGCVLYEMLARRPAFHGETVTDTFAKILERDPDWSALPPGTPDSIRQLLGRYLTKDPDRRLKDLGYARIVIEETLGQPSSPGLPGGPARLSVETGAPLDRAVSGIADGVSGVLHKVGDQIEQELASEREIKARVFKGASLGWMAIALVTGMAAAVLLMKQIEEPVLAPESEVLYASVLLSEGTRAGTSLGTHLLAISPDGQRLAVVASRDGADAIYWREMDQPALTLLQGTEEASSIFFSWDGNWIGFYTADHLKKVSLTTGSVVELADATSARGGTWAPDDTIYFPPTQLSGLHRVSANGGNARPFTELDAGTGELSHRWPSMLPGGQALLMNVELPGSFENARIEAVEIHTGSRHLVVEGGMSPVYSLTGHVLFARAGHLVAVPFDVEALQVTGPEIRLTEQVLAFANSGTAQYDLSSNGTLVYMANDATLKRRLVRVTEDGRVERLTEEPRALFSLRLSPDGRRVALCIDNTEIWIFERDRGTLTRLTTDPASDQHPVWSPDGKWIYFSSTRAGVLSIYRKPSDGSGAAELVLEQSTDLVPTALTADGETLAYYSDEAGDGWKIWTLPLQGEGKPETFQNTPSFEEGDLSFSPDGKWAVFGSTEAGGYEIFVTPYPGPGGKWQISSGAPFEPRFSPDGRSILFRSGNRVMAVDFTPGDPPRLSPPRPLDIELPSLFSLGHTFEEEPDGKAFLTLEESPTSARVDLVMNWTEVLRRQLGGS